MDVPLAEFPAGEGPPVGIRAAEGDWIRLGLGQGALVQFGPDGGGAFAWGMSITRALVWIRLEAAAEGAAYCYHAGPGPLDPAVFAGAARELGCDHPDLQDLYVVVASRGDVTSADEGFLAARGVRPGRIFTYSNSLTPQFGVSARGCVGEVR